MFGMDSSLVNLILQIMIKTVIISVLGRSRWISVKKGISFQSIMICLLHQIYQSQTEVAILFCIFEQNPMIELLCQKSCYLIIPVPMNYGQE